MITAQVSAMQNLVKSFVGYKKMNYLCATLLPR